MGSGQVVGFDLDMTLVDSRPGMRATLREMGLDPAIADRIGPPLSELLPAGVDADDYRERYALHAHETQALPGARAAVEEIRSAGGRVVVATAKREDNARRCLAAAGLEVDAVHGSLWAEGKGNALRSEGAGVFVGDHPGDVVAARTAGAWSIGVRTGPEYPVGADDVLESLEQLPGALALARMMAALRELGRVVVAFSGGADSALVLAAAVRALGPSNVVAATAVSASLPATELTGARAFAGSLGVRHVTPRTDEMARDGYRENAGNRCYFCKSELLDVLRPVAGSLGVAHVLTGTNADDAVAGFRPGIRAAAERGAVTPLLDAGFTKAQVREVSRRLGLATWDKPAAACLSSRIAYGIQITPAALSRVDRAEAALRGALLAAGHDVRDLRVRDLGDGVARVEVDLALVPAARDCLGVVEGFESVTVDPRGFRSGSMNDALQLGDVVTRP